jgi:hypothetical protein
MSPISKALNVLVTGATGRAGEQRWVPAETRTTGRADNASAAEVATDAR